MARKKIALIGGGQIGDVLAQFSALRELGDVILFDVVEGSPRGKTLDFSEASPVDGFDSGLKGVNSYQEIAGADIIIITAGLPRKPGMDRDNLIAINSRIMTTVAEGIKQHAPDAFIICISSPLDAMVTLCQKVTGFPKNRVMGMAGVQDSSCFAAFIAWELGVSVKDVTALLMDGHGANMVPLIRYANMFGIPVTALLEKICKSAAKAEEVMDAMVKRAANAGGEVAALLKTGSAFYSLASSAICMTEAILRDQKRFLPVCALLEGEYGVNGYYVGVPCMLGKNGIEKIIEFDLNCEEQVLFNNSVSHAKALVDSLKQDTIAYL